MKVFSAYCNDKKFLTNYEIVLMSDILPAPYKVNL